MGSVHKVEFIKGWNGWTSRWLHWQLRLLTIMSRCALSIWIRIQTASQLGSKRKFFKKKEIETIRKFFKRKETMKGLSQKCCRFSTIFHWPKKSALNQKAEGVDSTVTETVLRVAELTVPPWKTHLQASRSQEDSKSQGFPRLQDCNTAEPLHLTTGCLERLTSEQPIFPN